MHSTIFQRALATNSTASAFTAKIPVAVEPSGTGIFKMENPIPTFLQLVPFGTDANDETFDFRLYGWTRIHSERIWVPQLLADVSVTLGNMSAAVIAASTFLADTLTYNDGPPAGPFQSLIDAQEDLPASVMVHTRGCEYIEFDFDMVLAASGNVLWRGVE